MSPDEFVAKYGITGGAMSVHDKGAGEGFSRHYRLEFSIDGRTGKFTFNQNYYGNAGLVVAALTPVTFVAALAESARLQGPSMLPLPFSDIQQWCTFANGFDDLREWMGPQMWSDLLTVT